MTRLLPFLLLIACASGEENTAAEVLADYDADLAAIDQLVTDHVAAVGAAADLDAVSALEASYGTDWAALHDQLAGHMETLEGCSMSDDGMGMMDDATLHMDEMDTTVADHMAGHDAHTDVAQCQADETTHRTSMTEHMDAMMGYSTTWSGSMTCGMGGGGGMGM